MVKHRLYYSVKPFIPATVRLALRRMHARGIRERCSGTWPINPEAARPPAGWAGWPEGKQFAFVLTHDVEGTAGLNKCRQLMELEMKLGFRSSFNFIPQGEYDVPREFRDELVRNGFEVGVHDLRHDGKLFLSRREFLDNAARINDYLRGWGATGFRAGFMLNNLDWLRDLNVQYDASTFDTDPFEPQPGGVHTIFPFWVPRPDGGGYVELPYTLPQDSTMFLVLQESSTTIWKEKLDWIARSGGMALMIVHPDYLRFKGDPAARRTFPVEYYEEFLSEVKRRYEGAYWHALPKEVAAWQVAQQAVARTTPPRPRLPLNGGPPAPRRRPATQRNPATTGAYGGTRLRGRRAAVVMFSHYPADPRPCRAADALAREGVSVDILCLQRNSEEPRQQTTGGIDVCRVPIKRRRGGGLVYLWQYSSFLLAAFFRLATRSTHRRYDLIHVHNMPDILVFSALVPKLLGSKVILDLHDPMPELMRTIFELEPDSFAVRLLERFEKWSTGFADLVLTVNRASQRIYSSRSCPVGKIHVMMNSPDDSIFEFRPVPPAVDAADRARPFVMMYHGSLLHRNGFDIAVEALRLARRTIPNAKLVVCGERTDFFDTAMAAVQEPDLRERIEFLGPMNHRQIVETIDRCDVGVIPNRRNTFTEMNTPTRIFEYLARGKPVIAPRAQGILDYFDEDELLFFELGDAEDLARQVEFAFTQPEKTREVVDRGQQVYLDHTWSQEKSGFLDAVSELLDGQSTIQTSGKTPAVAAEVA